MYIEKKLIEVIKNVLEEEGDIKITDKLSDHNVNSIKFIELMVEIEDAFGVEFDDEELLSTDYLTFESFLSYILAREDKQYEI